MKQFIEFPDAGGMPVSDRGHFDDHSIHELEAVVFTQKARGGHTSEFFGRKQTARERSAHSFLRV